MMPTPDIKQRQTKYCTSIEEALAVRGHATNLELLHDLRVFYPEVSATTVHRATTRLAERGAIALAPSSLDGSLRYDHTVTPHDHFMCTSCGDLRNTNVVDQVKPVLEASIDGCSIEGRLTIGGICKQCKEERS